MLISDIIPYERNARHNEKAIPVVAESSRSSAYVEQSAWSRRKTP